MAELDRTDRRILHLLQRDARTLTTALMDAGLQADSGSLSFNLHGQSGDQAATGDQAAAEGAAASAGDAHDDRDETVAPITLTLGPGRVDFKV